MHSSSRRLRLLPLVLVGVALCAILLSGCALFKPGSLRLTQPAGIGPVQVHFELCSTDEQAGPTPPCEPSQEEGQEGQQMLALAVPVGTTAPATVTAAPKPGAQPMVYFRNAQVGTAFATELKGTPENPWPPAGSEIVGYMTNPILENPTPLLEWTVDAAFGLPPAADGGSAAAPFALKVASGWRLVSEPEFSASRPVDCNKGEFPQTLLSQCYLNEGATVGVSDLKITAPKRTTVFPGGKGTLAFSFDFASSAGVLPSFGITGSTTLPKGSVSVPDRVFAPGPVAGATFRAALATRSVVVAVPKGAKPGTYDVTITATTVTGGVVSQLGKLKVSRPVIKFVGKAKPNKASGSAIVAVKVPAGGTLTASGKGIVTTKKSAKKAKSLKLTIRAKGKAKAALLATGKVTVKAKFRFKPQSGAAVTKSKSLVLQLLGPAG